MALQSELMRGDSQLEAAAVRDSAHILPGSQGPHVVKIQRALIQLTGAAITADGKYGPATATAVADFKRKQKPQILNSAGKIDNIVGIKTIAALDAGMRSKGSRLQLNVGNLTITFVDIVVNLIGAAGASPRSAEEALPQNLLAVSYNPVPDPLNRNRMRHKTNNKLLFRLAHTTNEIGIRSMPLLLTLSALIASALSEKDPANGNQLRPDKIFIFGSSSGGRNAIDLAGMLAQAGNVPHFVASIDASFFQADTADQPSDNPNRVLKIPTFSLNAASPTFFQVIRQVPNRHNFFQTKGNHRGESFNPFEGPFFTSDMAGGLQEIHGNVQDFQNEEIPVTGAFGVTDDAFHEECDALGRLKVQQIIAKQLRGI